MHVWDVFAYIQVVFEFYLKDTLVLAPLPSKREQAANAVWSQSDSNSLKSENTSKRSLSVGRVEVGLTVCIHHL